jgi:hypothetical protein
MLSDLVRAFLPDYLRLVEPGVVEHLDLENLSFPEVGASAGEDLASLVVAEAATRGRDPAVLVVLIEPMAAGEAAVARRLGRLFETFAIPLGRPLLVSLLFLRGGKPGVSLDSVPASTLGGLANVRVYYTAFGLSGSAAEYYLERPEPLAWALAAWMGSRRLDRAALAKACRERIAAAALQPARRRLLLSCVRAARGR